MTSLYFANAEWQDNWHGEILLYDRRGEPFYAVASKPRRVLIFPGILCTELACPHEHALNRDFSVPFKFKSSC